MSNDQVSFNAGANFMSLLQVAFIVLKLCNVIDWSWWWVLAPIWIPAAIAVFIIVVALSTDVFESGK